MNNRNRIAAAVTLTGALAGGIAMGANQGHESLSQSPAAVAEATPSATATSEPTAKPVDNGPSSTTFMGNHHHHNMNMATEAPAVEATAEPEVTKAPAKPIVVNQLGANACRILVKSADDLHPERTDVWIDDLAQLDKDATALDTELEKESDSGKYSEEALTAGMRADESIKITREEGADDDKAKAMEAVAYAVENYCPDEQILD